MVKAKFTKEESMEFLLKLSGRGVQSSVIEGQLEHGFYIEVRGALNLSKPLMFLNKTEDGRYVFTNDFHSYKNGVRIGEPKVKETRDFQEALQYFFE